MNSDGIFYNIVLSYIHSLIYSVHIYEYLQSIREHVNLLLVSLLGLEIGDRNHPVRSLCKTQRNNWAIRRIL